jgi:hypothetical protein
MRSNLWKYSPAAILLIFAASGGLAQMTTAEIAGSIRDPQALAMPAVPISAVNQKTGQRFAGETNNLGEFLLRALPLGDYSVEAQAGATQPTTGICRIHSTGWEIAGWAITKSLTGWSAHGYGSCRGGVNRHSCRSSSAAGGCRGL